MSDDVKPREFWLEFADSIMMSSSNREIKSHYKDGVIIHVREVLHDDLCPKCEESKSIRMENVKID